MSSHPDQHTGLVAYVIDPDAGEQSTTPISTTVEAMCNQRLELFEEWKEKGLAPATAWVRAARMINQKEIMDEYRRPLELCMPNPFNKNRKREPPVPYFKHKRRENSSGGEINGAAARSDYERVGTGGHSQHGLVQMLLKKHNYAEYPLRFVTFKQCKAHCHTHFTATADMTVELEARELNPENQMRFVTDVVFYYGGYDGAIACRVEVVHSHPPERERREGIPYIVIDADLSAHHFNEGHDYMECIASVPTECPECEQERLDRERREELERRLERVRQEREVERARLQKEKAKQEWEQKQKEKREHERLRLEHRHFSRLYELGGGSSGYPWINYPWSEDTGREISAPRTLTKYLKRRLALIGYPVTRVERLDSKHLRFLFDKHLADSYCIFARKTHSFDRPTFTLNTETSILQIGCSGVGECGERVHEIAVSFGSECYAVAQLDSGPQLRKALNVRDLAEILRSPQERENRMSADATRRAILEREEWRQKEQERHAEVLAEENLQREMREKERQEQKRSGPQLRKARDVQDLSEILQEQTKEQREAANAKRKADALSVDQKDQARSQEEIDKEVANILAAAGAAHGVPFGDLHCAQKKNAILQYRSFVSGRVNLQLWSGHLSAASINNAHQPKKVKITAFFERRVQSLM